MTRADSPDAGTTRREGEQRPCECVVSYYEGYDGSYEDSPEEAKSDGRETAEAGQRGGGEVR